MDGQDKAPLAPEESRKRKVFSSEGERLEFPPTETGWTVSTPPQGGSDEWREKNQHREPRTQRRVASMQINAMLMYFLLSNLKYPSIICVSLIL